MIEYSILALSQIANSFLRAWNIKTLGSGNKVMAHISWQLYGVSHLVSLSLGIKSVIEFDWIGITIWFVFSGIGQELSFRIKDNAR